MKRRSPRAPVTRTRALEVAMKLADVGGIGDLSMRKLAEALGIEAMSLYHHVANKEALLDGMVDLVFAEIGVPLPSDDWRVAIRQRTASVCAVIRRHPWALQLMESRRAPGLATLAHHDAVIGGLRRAGFSVALAAHAYAVLDSLLYGFLLTEQNLPFQTSDQTQEVTQEILDRFPASSFPYLVEMAVEHVMQPGYSFADELERGLELVLDGLERARRKEQQAARRPRADAARRTTPKTTRHTTRRTPR